MDYKEYIELGFERVDYDDEVVFRKEGHHPFVLTREITDKLSIEVCFPNLDTPKLYIKMRNDSSTRYSIFRIEDEVIRDLCAK
jgi:hypothetical protein